MKIVILDSETVSRNDVSLEGITVLGESIVYGFTPNEQVAEKIATLTLLYAISAL